MGERPTGEKHHEEEKENVFIPLFQQQLMQDQLYRSIRTEMK